ncbi:MAG: sensor histidine kinase [Deltaproteobacteria bacterium]|nr:MAG: sensor histidine kinase [Deltaproteobacteria bacterium]
MSGSIRNRIVLSHWLVVLLVLLLLGPTACWLLSGELEKQRFQELDFLASHMAGMVDNRLEWYSRQLSDLVRDPLIRSFPETARVPAVADLLGRQREVFPVMVYMDAKGWEEVRVVHGQPQVYLAPFDDQAFFSSVEKKPNRIVTGKPLKSALSGEKVIPMGYGIRRYFGDRFIGALYGELRLSRLTSFLGTVPVGRTGFILLVDEQRRLLYHPDAEKVFAPLAKPGNGQDWVQMALDGERGVGEGEILGVEVLLGYAPVKSLNAALVAVLPMEEFLEAPNKMKKAILLVMAVLLVVAALVARWFASRLTRPLLQLTDLAGQIAGGALPEQINIQRTGDEIDQLVDTFGNMLAELRNSMVSRHYLDRILAGMNEALLLVGLDGRVRTANRAACELLGRDQTDLVGQQLESLFKVEAQTSEPWLQVLLASPGESRSRQQLKGVDGLIPVNFAWTVLADGSGHVREVACLFSPETKAGLLQSDLGQGQH